MVDRPSAEDFASAVLEANGRREPARCKVRQFYDDPDNAPYLNSVGSLLFTKALTRDEAIKLLAKVGLEIGGWNLGRHRNGACGWCAIPYNKWNPGYEAS